MNLTLIFRSTPEQQELYKSALRAALIKGHKVLVEGGNAMDAATAAVVSMEGTHTLEYVFGTLPAIRLSAVQLCKGSGIQCRRQGTVAPLVWVSVLTVI